MEMEMEEVIAELLPEILSNLEPHDLLTCRLVNRDWNHVSCRYLKQRCEAIHLRTNEDLQHFISTVATINAPDFPFSKIYMNLSYVVKENVELFASTFGSHVVEYDLDLDFTGSTSTVTYYKLVEKVGILLKSSPDLEILRIKDENIEMDFTKFKFLEYFPAELPRLHVLEISVDQLLRQSIGTKTHFGLLYELVKICPQLQLFVIHFIGNGFWNSQLSNLLIAMQNVPRISFVNLSIRTEDVRRGNIASLVAIKCQIQDLSLVIMNSSCNPQVLFHLLFDWLEIDGQMLMKFQLKTDNVGFCIPRLKNLLSLEINLTKKSDLKENNFLQRFTPELFPRLETLNLCNYSETYDYFSTEIFPKVTSLRLEAYQEEVITHLWNCNFPNLKKMELFSAMPKHLEFVFSHFSKIRNLTVVFNLEKSESATVAGILTGVGNPMLISDGLNDRHPSLSNMENLETLRIGNCSTETLDALVSMSSTGQLHGLGSLRCTVKSPHPTDQDVSAVQSKLNQFHNRVVIRNDAK